MQGTFFYYYKKWLLQNIHSIFFWSQIRPKIFFFGKLLKHKFIRFHFAKYAFQFSCWTNHIKMWWSLIRKMIEIGSICHDKDLPVIYFWYSRQVNFTTAKIGIFIYYLCSIAKPLYFLIRYNRYILKAIITMNGYCPFKMSSQFYFHFIKYVSTKI